jgi:hypothetical protein
MLCVTHGLNTIATPWAYTHPQAVLTDLLDVKTHKGISSLRPAQRRELAGRAVEELDAMTTRMSSGFAVMSSGSDKTKPWRAKAYVSIVNRPLKVRLTGPDGSADECKTVELTLGPGEVLVACSVRIRGVDRDKPTFPQGFKTKPQTALKGVVCLGLCAYQPREMPAAAPGIIVAPVLRAARPCPEDDRLNAAFVELDDAAFASVKVILGLRGEEEETIFKMSTNKRRRLREIFHLIANCDPSLQELAQSVAASEEEEEEEQPAATGTSLAAFAASEKCVCGISSGKTMVEFGKQGKGEKMPLW